MTFVVEKARQQLALYGYVVILEDDLKLLRAFRDMYNDLAKLIDDYSEGSLTHKERVEWLKDVVITDYKGQLEKHREALSDIISMSIDYDGFSWEEDLKGLIDDMANVAKMVLSGNEWRKPMEDK